MAQSSADTETIQQQLVLVQYLTDSHLFAQNLRSVIRVASQLLGSKTNTDIKEAIEFFITAAVFQVAGHMEGVRKMLVLMWSKDNDIRQTVMDAYRRLYLSPDPAIYTTQKVKMIGAERTKSHISGFLHPLARARSFTYSHTHSHPLYFALCRLAVQSWPKI